MSNQRTRKLVESGVLIALATILSLIQIKLPFGGGLTIVSMLPIVLISYRNGLKWGFFSAFVYGLLQMLVGMSTVKAFFVPEDYALWAGIGIVLLDYIVAYTMLGFGGISRNKLKPSSALCVGSIVALFLRYLVHCISGAIFFGAWAEWFFTQEGFGNLGSNILERFSGTELAIIYSIIYNGIYMIPEIIITAIVAYAIGKIPAIQGRNQ